MQPKRRRPAAKNKRRASHAASLRKYTEEERRAREAEHAPVNREHFEQVIRRLITAPPPKRKG